MNKWLLKTSRFFADFFIGVISLIFFSATTSHAAPTLDGITIQYNGDDSLNQTLDGGTIRFVLEMSHEILSVDKTSGTPYILLSRIKNLASGADSSTDDVTFRALYAGAAQGGNELYFEYPIKAGDFSAGVDVRGSLELNGGVIHTSGGDVPTTIDLADASPYTEGGYRIQVSTFYIGSSGTKEVEVDSAKAMVGATYYATIHTGGLVTENMPFDIFIDYAGGADVDFEVKNQYGVGGTVNSWNGNTVSTYLSPTGSMMRLAITPKDVLDGEQIKIRIRPSGAGGDTSGDMFVIYPNGIDEEKVYIKKIYVDANADNKTYTKANQDIIRINVEFSKKVTRVSGIPLLYLNVNNQNNAPNYQNNNFLKNYAVYNESRSSGNTVAFDYTVKAGDYIADLDAIDLDFNTFSGKFEFSDGSQFNWNVPQGTDPEGLAYNCNVGIQTILFSDYGSTTAAPEVKEENTLDLRVTRGAAVAGYAQTFAISSDKANGDKIEYPTTFAIPAGSMDAVLSIRGVDMGTQTLRLHPYGYDDASGDLVATIEVKKGDNDPSVRLSSAQNSFSEGSDPFTMTLGLSRQPKENIMVTVYADKPECVRIVGGGQTSAGNVFTFPRGSSTTFDISVAPLDGPQTVTIYAVATNTSYSAGYKFTTANYPIQIRTELPDANVSPTDEDGNWVITDFMAGTEGYIFFSATDPSYIDLRAGIEATIIFGDGTQTTVACDASGYCDPVSHTYARPGTYRIKLMLRDKDGSTRTISGTAIVKSPIDYVTVEMPLRADGCFLSDFWAGVQGAVSWCCSCAEWTPDFTMDADFGDGSHETVSCNANNAGVAFHTYSYPGVYYITLKATDSTGSTKTTRGFVKVNPQGYEGVTAAGNSGNGGNGEAMDEGEVSGGTGNVVAGVSLTVTNVIVHYVTQSIPSDAVIPSTTAGIVNVITEVDAGAPVAISPAWAEQYPDFEAKFGSDFSAAIVAETGKRDGAGNAMRVWQDFVAGTDPTDPNSVFTATITFDAGTGQPVISWSPELSPEEAAKRTYRKYGKVKLTDEDWTEIDGDEASYNFFKVSVEMK